MLHGTTLIAEDGGLAAALSISRIRSRGWAVPVVPGRSGVADTAALAEGFHSPLSLAAGVLCLAPSSHLPKYFTIFQTLVNRFL